jgi:hypothetical protein
LPKVPIKLALLGTVAGDFKVKGVDVSRLVDCENIPLQEN